MSAPLRTSRGLGAGPGPVAGLGLIAGLGLTAGLGLAGCDDLVNLTETAAPLAQVQVQIEGDLPADVDPTRVRVALLWGTQYISDFFCLVPPTDAEARAVVAAGCRDPFGFVPLRVGANAAAVFDGPTTLDLFDLPAADVMVGTLTARIGHGSVVVYEDRNQNRTFDLACVPRRGRGPDCDATAKADPETDDRVLGASFASMTRADQRLTFREGGFEPLTAFYPRAGCPEPPAGFSVLGAGGFSSGQAFLDILQGRLPQQDPATCTQAPLETGRITVALVPDLPPPAQSPLQELSCGSGEVQGGFVEYQAPPPKAPDADRPFACAPVPDLASLTGGGGDDEDGAEEGDEAPPEPRPVLLQTVLAGPPDARCKTVTHWLLRGCEDDPRCATPEWDFTRSPPDWWPCPVTPETP